MLPENALSYLLLHRLAYSIASDTPINIDKIKNTGLKYNQNYNFGLFILYMNMTILYIVYQNNLIVSAERREA